MNFYNFKNRKRFKKVNKPLSSYCLYMDKSESPYVQFTLNLLKSRFFDFLNFAKFYNSLDFGPPVDFEPSNRLSSAALRITKPHTFSKFVEYCSNTLKTKINFDFSQVTKDYVISKDQPTFDEYSKSNWNFSNLNLTYLLQAAIDTSVQFRYVYSFNNVSTVDNSIESLPKDTSAGYPLYGKKRSLPAKMDAYTWVSKYLRNPDLSKLMSNPCTIYHRFVAKLSEDLQSNEVKVRIVWGLPFRVVLLESVFFDKPLKDIVNHFAYSEDINTCLGKRNLSISNSIYKMRLSSNNILQGDYSKYDSTIPGYMIVLYFAVRSFFINLENPNLFEAFRHLLIYIIYTPYCYMNSELSFTRKGSPSGSKITADLNCFVNATIINYAYREKSKGKICAPLNSYSVLGDDNLISLDYFSFAYFQDVVSRFGMTINPQKSVISSSTSSLNYLGRIWDENNRPTQTTKWFVEHICVPSKFFIDQDIPISYLQTYRAISVCAPLYQGLLTYKALMNGQDKVLNLLFDRLYKGEPVEIKYYGREDLGIQTINLSTLLKYDWKAF